ncbi:MAG: GNAT family N-acetyltransferase [Clostridia bacterium]|nr:GNAT family N-acetyltransferase [Clostridia bacterium]
MNYIIEDNQLRAEDFVRLFASAGWGELPCDLVQIVLLNSYATFSVVCGDRVIAMARLLGDGAMSFFLKDFVVEPSFQGHGIGRSLLLHIEEYIHTRLQSGWEGYLQLVSAKGKEGFYQKAGYSLHPNEHCGSGMSKWIIKKQS